MICQSILFLFYVLALFTTNDCLTLSTAKYQQVARPTYVKPNIIILHKCSLTRVTALLDRTTVVLARTDTYASRI